MSLIYKHYPTGGELHQSGAFEIPFLIKRKNIYLLILSAEEYQPVDLFPLKTLHVPLEDSSRLSKTELEETIKNAKKAANLGIQTILTGRNVLSTCWAGLNRSSLISAFMLKKLTQLPSDKVISLIRTNRNQSALFNPLFAKSILCED